jgi:hypothetical protein
MSVRIEITSLLSGLLAFAAVVPALAGSDARVEAFRTACIPDRQDFEAILVRASPDGWKLVTGEAHPALKAVLAASVDPGASGSNSIRAFREEIAGRPTFLVTSRVTSGQYVLVGCYLYDFAATTPLAPELFNDWLGGPPAAEMNEPGNAVGYQWETPQTLPGTWDVYATFIAEGGAGARETGFSGLAMKITSNEAVAK